MTNWDEEVWVREWCPYGKSWSTISVPRLYVEDWFCPRCHARIGNASYKEPHGIEDCIANIGAQVAALAKWQEDLES